MTHDEAVQLLSARIDGPLAADQQQALDAWLAESPDHAILAEAFQTQHGELRTTFEPRREAARETAAAVARQLPEPAVPSGGRWWRFLAAPLPAACAAALLIAFGLLVYRGRNTPTPLAPSAEAPLDDAVAAIGLTPRARPEAPKQVKLEVGNKIETGPGQKQRVVLPDGSLVYLNQNTKVALTRERHVELDAGEVFVEAVPAANEADKFVVSSNGRQVTALGTKFAVSSAAKGLGIQVTQGQVRVTGKLNKLNDAIDTHVATGEQLVNDKVVPAPRASAVLDWTRDLMAAAESPLVPAGKYSGGSLVAVDPYGQEAKLSLTKFHVDVHIEDGFARTTIDQTYFNSENWRMEGTFYFPLPPDASLSRLAMYVDGDLMEGGMAERQHARDVYERIRYQNRDPALLEWVDGSVFKMRVFPLEARQEKRIILSYTQRLPVLYGRATYRFPAGHTLALVDRWSFHANVKDGARMSALSPTHPDMKFAVNGKDLVADDETKNAKVDRDVVLELTDHQAQANVDSVRWSQGELDGQKYLMLRFRPDLPITQRRERRDWVFLFESSGARDPLVARAQVEVIRSLLTHAEHDDTFAILSVGTRVRKWNDTPLAASPENIAKAIDWLDHRHLIGALDLEQALADATPLLQAGPNPHLVHVGGGVASMGEQRADELVKRIPPGTRYVGIGVGKRVSPAFMKVAAERTGGLFTQVNPDEPIGWRGFEIASTLNAPRLLDVHVDAALADGTRFLTFSNAVAHGEELAAVVKVAGALPVQVTVRGLLDGQPFAKILPVSNVATGAGYLPRTWAKLEIDRLLADNSGGNQKAITDLSKAMYVMTPFTSLLVLENEQMYKDFQVDRGRKDHWAMYPCPPKIPVVYIPDPNQPAGTRPDLKGEKPHANAVVQTVMTRNPPPFLTWPGHGGGDTAVLTAGQKWGSFAVPDLADADEDLRDDALGVEAGDVEQLEKRLGDVRFGSRSSVRLQDESLKEMNSLADGITVMRRDGGERQLRRLDSRFSRDRKKQILDLREGRGGRSAFTPTQRGTTHWSDQSVAFDGPALITASGRVSNAPDAYALDFAYRVSDKKKKVTETALRLREGLSAGKTLLGANYFRMTDGRRINSEFRELEELGRVKAASDFAPHAPRPGRPSVTDLAVAQDREEGKPSLALLRIDPTSAPQYYGRPSFNGNFRVFTDLVSYAPGMSPCPADVQAVIEAEAAPRFGSRFGTIDPAARKLIDAARTTEWKALKLGDVTFFHDGQGRYFYDRRVAFGLLERVVCDGTHLWHLYPELGIGAERTVSRFHREMVFDLVPDFVPPVEDLAHGADVTAVDESTVAIKPLPPAAGEEPPAQWVEERLIFLGKLSERQWLLMPQKKVLLREAYGPNGTRYLDAERKEIDQSKRDESPAAAPNLKPDLGPLVVLPLPLRSRDVVYRELGMEPGYTLHQEQNNCFAYLDKVSAMRLLAAEFAANNGHNVADIWYNCFGQKGDDRAGFFTLMAAAGQNPRSYWGFELKFRRDPSDPLVRYLWELHDDSIHDWQARFGFGPGPADADTFLGKLTSFRRVVARWNGNHIGDELWGQRDSERRRAIAFAVRNADNVLGWCTLAMVQDHCPHAQAWKDVAEAWAVLAKKSALQYPALYEEARCLGNAGLAEPAQQKYQALFERALNEGVLPPLDGSFRSVLEGGKEDAWAKLMRETAANCAKTARPVIVTLAWQCYQLGDVAMADTLLEQALTDLPADQKAFTVLAAVHFLNATSRYDRADKEVRELLSDPELAKSAGLWRLASQTADNRRDSVRAIECLEKALDIEYARLPEVFDVQPIRNDYGRLLSHYEWLADASASLKVTPPKDLLRRVVKAADRWRQLDPEAADVPNRAAAILRKAGGDAGAELAWEYVTTPLALKPGEGSPWVSLAASLRQEGNWRQADRCYELAFAAEPTDAQLLWDRAQLLRQQGQEAEGRKLLKQVAEGDWQPRFNGLKAQARQAIQGR